MDQHPGAPRLDIDAAYYNALDIPSFALMLKDPSYCYKFYWLEAIVQLIAAGATQTTFDAVIDEMICSAWYSVREWKKLAFLSRLKKYSNSILKGM